MTPQGVGLTKKCLGGYGEELCFVLGCVVSQQNEVVEIAFTQLQERLAHDICPGFVVVAMAQLGCAIKLTVGNVQGVGKLVGCGVSPVVDDF